MNMTHLICRCLFQGITDEKQRGVFMDDFDRYLEEQLKNPEFKKEWEKNRFEYDIMKDTIKRLGENKHFDEITFEELIKKNVKSCKDKTDK